MIFLTVALSNVITARTIVTDMAAGNPAPNAATSLAMYRTAVTAHPRPGQTHLDIQTERQVAQNVHREHRLCIPCAVCAWERLPATRPDYSPGFTRHGTDAVCSCYT